MNWVTFLFTRKGHLAKENYITENIRVAGNRTDSRLAFLASQRRVIVSEMGISGNYGKPSGRTRPRLTLS